MTHGATKMKPVPKVKQPLKFEYKVIHGSVSSCESILNRYGSSCESVVIEGVSADNYGTTIVFKVGRYV